MHFVYSYPDRLDKRLMLMITLIFRPWLAVLTANTQKITSFTVKKKHILDMINNSNINYFGLIGALLKGLIDRNSNKECTNTLFNKRCTVHDNNTILPLYFYLPHRWFVF
ncbi:MAG: hypothetical protein ACI9C4_001844 [Paraglaciecola sp.]|jgi:hypothetical protein